MNNTVLLIGAHPLRESIKAQYEALGCAIAELNDLSLADSSMAYRELCIVPDESTPDQDTLQALEAFANHYPETPAGQSRPICHLLLHDKVTLWLLQTLNLYEAIHDKFELYAFTMEDQWAKNALCGLGCNGISYPPLDRERIDADSRKSVHFVIAGFGDIGESLALHAALVAHFPNYERNHALRTRITIIDHDLTAKRDAFIQRYIHLFEHSHYRCIDLVQGRMTQYHEPVYHATREDFVDVEWEFVDSDFYHPLLQRKLQLWADSDNRLLTLALCNDDCSTNFDRAFALPKAINDNGVSVLVYTKQAELLDKVRQTEGYRNLFPIGMDDCGYDISLPLLQMAKRLNYCYAFSYGQKGAPTDMPVEEIEAEWRQVTTFSMRYSNIYNVMTIATKMRSLGHEEKDWTQFFALTQEEVELLSAVEHNRWSVDRLILGFRPPTDTEREEIRQNIEAFIRAQKTGSEPPDRDLKNDYKKQKIHYDLCSYRELDIDKTGQDVRLYDYDLTSSIPLIAQSYKERLP